PIGPNRWSSGADAPGRTGADVLIADQVLRPEEPGRMHPPDQDRQGENQVMSMEKVPDHQQVPLEVLERIDVICDRFLAAWEAGGRPRIEARLAEVAEPFRPALVRDLLAGELDARRS